jgi:ABC-type branched-subunit amino acid transport system substrate-binding protein
MIKTTVLIIIICFSLLYPQEINSGAVKDFDNAIKLYKSKNFDGAINLFYKVANDPNVNPRTTAAKFFVTKILLDKKKYNEFEKSASEFLSRYPQSKYSNEVKNLFIKSFVDRSDFKNAFAKSLDFISSTGSASFRTETKLIAEKIALNYLNLSEVKNHLDSYNINYVKPFLLLTLGKLSLIEGDRINAVRSFDEVISNYSSSDEYMEALNFKNSAVGSEESLGLPVIGAMISLTDQSGKDIESAKEILEGIKYAFHEFNSEREDKIGLLIRDTRKDNSSIIETADQFIENDDVRCVIGPVFSEEVRIALQEFDRSNLCLISPTATDDDLIALSDNFFQANPPFSIRGKIFAQYLYYVENKRNIAVLNSIEGYSPLFAASFAKEFEKLTGSVVVKETYKISTYSLSEQLSRILTLGGSIEGIYVPLSDKNDATVILSQMVQSGLNTTLYGNQDWLLAKGFETSPEISNKLTFDSDYFIDFNSEDFKEFSKLFKQTTNLEVNRNILYGYDTAKYILTIMRNIDPTRKNIKFKMESGVNVNGYHNNISFDSDHINKFVNIVRYHDGIFELVDKFRAAKQ